MKTKLIAKSSSPTAGRLYRGVLVAFTALLLGGCSDIPLLPKWDADWSFPLASFAGDRLFGGFSVTVPPGTVVPLLYPIQQIDLDQRLGAILGQRMKTARLVITISKSLPVDGNYTLAVSRDAAGLLAAPDSGIALRFAVHRLIATNSDSANFSVAGLAMLQSVADAQGVLWVQLRGTTTNGGAGTLLIVPADSIAIQLSLRTTVAVSN